MSVVMLGFSAAGLCQTPYWQDVSTVEVNREAPRTEFVTYTSEEKALTRDFSSSENYQLLNGNWKFLYYDSYKDVPASVTDPATDDSSWNEIKVPGNWELQGYGTAIYVNHPYEFSPVNPQPPQLPEQSQPPAVQPESQDHEYILGEWEGRLAVYRTGESEPDSVLDVYLGLLPPADAQAMVLPLESVIVTIVLLNVDRRLEDFMS